MSSSPQLDERGNSDFWRVYDEHYDEAHDHLMKLARAIPDFARVIDRMSQEELDETSAASRRLMKAALLEDDWEPLLEHQQDQGASYAAMGVSFPAWAQLVQGFESIVRPELVGEFADDRERLVHALAAMTNYVSRSMTVIGEGYLAAKERIIAQQQAAIRELSTPVLQIKERMLLVPVIGVFDTNRARNLTEQLLHAIRAHRARAVVIDITGVPAVDSRVANHLMQTVSAARLMGARAVITGLSPEVAQALVQLGVDTSRLHTVGDLQEGLIEAERLDDVHGPDVTN